MPRDRSGQVTVTLKWVAEDVPDNCADIQEEVTDALNNITDQGALSEHNVMVMFGGLDEDIGCRITEFREHTDHEHTLFMTYLCGDPNQSNEGPQFEDLTHLGCPYCVREMVAKGMVGSDALDDEKQWPARKITMTGVSNRADPTVWYKLECGHIVI